MLSRTDVLAELAINECLQVQEAKIYKDKDLWIVEPWENCYCQFRMEEVLAAVDYFISCQAFQSDFPDAKDLKELCKREDEAQYNKWCEDNAETLQYIAAQICLAQLLHKRTIECDLPLEDAEGKFRRYFTDKHFSVTIQHYGSDRTDKRGYCKCRLVW